MLRKSKRSGVPGKSGAKSGRDSSRRKLAGFDEDELKFFFVLPESCNGDIDEAPENFRFAYSSYCQHWDKVLDKKSIISESSVMELDKNVIDRNDIFIFNKFDGKAFDFIKITDAL